MEREETVRAALVQFMSKHLPNTCIDDIDDIVLNYIVGVLEDLGTEDSFDVEGFVEMMEAYIPGFAELNSNRICDWMFQLADQPSKEKENTPPDTKKVEDEESGSTGAINLLRGTLNERLPEENDTDKSDQACGGSATKVCDVQEDDCEDDQIRLLLEMFPSSCVVEAQKCLTIACGDMEHATQLMLDRQMDDTYATTPTNQILETQVKQLIDMFPSAHEGDALSCITEAHGDINKAARLMMLEQSESTLSAYNVKTRQAAHKDDKKLKASILDKYGYVDTDEDSREHRPTAPKGDKKKMVRYINNQVVTTRGERVVDVKKPESDEMKKTYINLKPGRKYRFH